MNKREKLAFAFVAALAMTSGGLAVGQTINNVSSDQVIYACVTGVNGNITKVSNASKACPKGSSPISWNRIGPQGEAGRQGVQGEPGAAGTSYLDNIVVMNGDDPQEFVLQASYFLCLGGRGGLTSSGWWMCSLPVGPGKSLTLLDVAASGAYRGPAKEALFYVVPGSCPANPEDLENVRLRGPSGYLVSGGAPFSYILPESTSCFIVAAANDNSQGLYQIIGRVNQAN